MMRLGFAKGVGECAWDGVKGTDDGVGDLTKDGYKLAADSQYRRQAWNSAANDAKRPGRFAVNAVTDLVKAPCCWAPPSSQAKPRRTPSGCSATPAEQPPLVESSPGKLGGPLPNLLSGSAH